MIDVCARFPGWIPRAVDLCVEDEQIAHGWATFLPDRASADLVEGQLQHENGDNWQRVTFDRRTGVQVGGVGGWPRMWWRLNRVGLRGLRRGLGRLSGVTLPQFLPTR